MRIALRKTLLVLVSALLSASVGAANVVITNSDGLTIAIKPATSVQFDASGNLNVQCQTVSANDNRCCVVTDSSNCVPLGSTQTPADTTPPTAPSGLGASATSDTSINLSWTASTDVGGTGVAQYRIERCVGAGCSNFSQISTTTNTSFSSSGLTASTSYSYRVRATDVAGNNSAYSNTAAATTQSSGGTTACSITDPLIAPVGMTVVNKSWGVAFGKPWNCTTNCAQPSYPQSWSEPMPIGTNKNTVLAIAIDPTSNTQVQMFWDPAQNNNSISYISRSSLGMLVAISPCPGDVRPPDDSSSDPFLRSTCRKLANSDGLLYSTFSTNPNFCKLQAGTRYYINVTPTNTTDGFTPPETLCSPDTQTGCDVQMRHDTI